MRPTTKTRSGDLWLGLLLIVAAAVAISTLPRERVPYQWIVAFSVPTAVFYAMTRGMLERLLDPWLRITLTGILQATCVWLAFLEAGPLQPPAALACVLLPPITFFTLRRQPPDIGLSLFLSFCFLLIGTMLSMGKVDARVLVFIVVAGLTMQCDVSTRTHLLRHSSRHESGPALRRIFDRLRIVFGLLVACCLVFSAFALVPAPREPNRPSRNYVSPSRSNVGLSSTFDLSGSSGSPLNLESDRLLHVTDIGGLPLPSDLYLRMTFFDLAGLEEWTTSTPPTYRKRVPVRGLELHRRVPRLTNRSLQVVHLEPMQQGRLFVPPGGFKLYGPEVVVWDQSRGYLLDANRPTIRSYRVDYQQTEKLPGSLAVDQSHATRRLTNVPSGLRSQELEQLANEYAAAAGPGAHEVEIARAMASRLQAHCKYELRDPTGKYPDAVHNFLFGDRRGYCMHFATALAVMLRLQGVPCRIGVGLHAGDALSGQRGRMRVFGSQNAHAWVEIPLAGQLGWLVVDPTPAASRSLPGWPSLTPKLKLAETAPEERGWMTKVWDQTAKILHEPLEFLKNPKEHPVALMSIIGLGVLVLLASVLSRLSFVRRRAGVSERTVGPDEHEVRKLLEQILRQLGRATYPKPTHFTLEQYLCTLSHSTGEELDKVASSFLAYQQVRFGQRPLNEERRDQMVSALHAVRDWDPN